jgi:hypothetical protein
MVLKFTLAGRFAPAPPIEMVLKFTLAGRFAPAPPIEMVLKFTLAGRFAPAPPIGGNKLFPPSPLSQRMPPQYQRDLIMPPPGAEMLSQSSAIRFIYASSYTPHLSAPRYESDCMRTAL